MARVTLTPAEIRAGLNSSGYRLGDGQYTFSIPTAVSVWPTYATPGEPFASDYAVLDAVQAASFRAALAGWDELIAPDFTEVADDATTRGEIRVAFTSHDMGQGTTAYAYQSVSQPAGGKAGDVWLNTDTADLDYARGTYWFETLVHEIGHSLGLKHPFDPPVIPAAFEDRRYTVMSYSEPTAGQVVTFALTGSTLRATFSYVTAVTPMVLDIAAVQSIYGADPGTRSGDTVYRFDQDDRFLQSIYDAGGNDTIDLSNVTRPNTIDLAPGAYSSVGEWGLEAQIAAWTALFPNFAGFIRSTLSARDLFVNGDNVGIALSTVIENATGGSAADRITGNAVANILRGLGGGDTISGGDGDDRIEGGAGDDVLTGGAGADTFVFGAGDGADRITDFTLAEDRIDLAGGSFTAISDTAAGAVLTHHGGTVLLAGTSGVTLTQVNARVIGATEILAPAPAPTPTPTPTSGPTPAAPALSALLASWPGDGTADFPTTAPIRLVFDGVLARGTGTLVLSRADGTVVETFSAFSPRLTLTGNVLSVDPTRALDPATGYTLQIAGGVLLVGGAPFAGLSSYDFTTAPRAVLPADAYDLILPAGAQATATGSGDVFGTAGAQRVLVADHTARVTLDPSFNQGGDTLVLAGPASGWSVVRTGSSLQLSDGDTVVVVPVGIVGTDIQFADGPRTLRFNSGVSAILLGDQVVTTAEASVTAVPNAATVARIIDASVASQLIVAPGAAATATGILQLFGTSGSETIIALGSRITFDPSFNAGGDAVVLTGRAGDYTAARSGSSLVLENAAQVVTIPVGIVGATVRFADGERALAFERTASGTIAGMKLGDQMVGTTASAVTPVATVVATLDRDDDGSILSAFAIDAAAGNIRFTDDPATAQNVRLLGFGRGDQLVLAGSTDDYLFARSGGDLIVQRVGTGGVLSTTTLVGVADPSVVVMGEASAERAVGFDFATFAI